MFFILGISRGGKFLTYELMVQCPHCGKWERCVIQMQYTCLDFFFIPLIKWDKEYLLRMNCCQSIFQLDPEIGKQIAKKEEPPILAEHLQLRKAGIVPDHQHLSRHPQPPRPTGEETRVCPRCGTALSKDQPVCPGCGETLRWA